MAFRIINKNLKFDVPLYPKVERKLATSEEKGWVKVDGFTIRKKVDYMPQVGLQEDVCRCESNIIFMCGAASMGKSFAEILLVLYGIDKIGRSSAMISTRLQDSKKGSSIFRDNELVLGKFAGCEYNTSDYPTFYWPQWTSVHRLIHSNFNTDNPTERSQFIEYAKKNQNGLQIFDEANDLPEFQYHYWNSRNRDSSGMTPQSVYSFNPPDPDNYFTRILRGGGYIDSSWHFDLRMNGVTRYFFSPTDNVDDYIWGDTPEEVAIAAHIEITEKDRAAGLTPEKLVKSFTAFTGEASDNRELVYETGGGSVSNLLYSGQADVLKGAYFGYRESEEIRVSRSMLHSLWENPTDDDESMYATMDVSLGKTESDNSPMLIWQGLQLVDIVLYKSGENIVDFIERNLRQYNVPVSNFAYDATGAGMLLEQFVKSGAIGITANRRCVQEIDEYGNNIAVDEYFNLRSQLLGKTEVMLKRGDISIGVEKDRILQYGKKGQTRKFFDILCDEINVFATTTRNKKIYYRSKDEYKSKFRSSPDMIDAFSYRAYFELSAKERKQPKPQVEEDAYDALTTSSGGQWGRSAWRNFNTRYIL